MKIALVHDYLSQDGGAERVLKTLHETWPEAPIFVLFHDPKKIKYIPEEKIHQSFLSRFPFIRSAYTWYLPLMPKATEKYDLNEFDVILSSTSAFAKGVNKLPKTMHVSYCHTPPRYLWSDTVSYISSLKRNTLVKLILPDLLHRLRLWDKSSTDRVDYFIANSETVRQRINKYYRRDAEVIHPPVEAKNFTPEPTGEFFLAGGRIVPYKRFDLIVSAFNRLKWPIKIFGIGPELNKLKRRAKSNIQFLGAIDEIEKRNLYSRARAFINPQLEDFGLTALEAMAAGRPVIAYKKGGATETIIEGQTGLFFNKQNWESLYNILLKFNHENWDSNQIHEHALKFDTPIFKDKMKRFVEEKWKIFQSTKL